MIAASVLEIVLLLAGGPTHAAIDPCGTTPDVAVTTPAPVDVDRLLAAILRMRSADGRAPDFVEPEKVKESVRKLFSTAHPTSKLHQFYGLLHLLARHTKPLRTPGASEKLDAAGIREVLLISKAAPSPEVAGQIASVGVSADKVLDYQYHFNVRFSTPKLVLPLNAGRGFGIFREGKCQHAKALVFLEAISFRTRELPNGNLLVHKFRNVDLDGDFGARTWIVDVDLNHVSLEEVEFFAGTNRARVKAYVSEREFQANEHPWLLSMLMRVVPDNSVQVMDW